VVCLPETPCTKHECNSIDGTCSVVIPLPIGESCDDGNDNSSTTGTCQKLSSGELVCRADAFIYSAPKCQKFDYCNHHECFFNSLPDNEVCDDDFAFTSGDNCLTGECVPTAVRVDCAASR